MRRPAAAAAAETSGQLQAMGPLLAVIDVHAEAERLEDVVGRRRRVRGGAGGYAREVAHHGELDEHVGAWRRRATRGPAGPPAAGPARSPTAASTSAGVMPAGSSRLPWRVPAAATSTRSPCRSASSPLLRGEQIAERARDAAEAEQAELDLARSVRPTGWSSNPANEMLTSRGRGRRERRPAGASSHRAREVADGRDEPLQLALGGVRGEPGAHQAAAVLQSEEVSRDGGRRSLRPR